MVLEVDSCRVMVVAGEPFRLDGCREERLEHRLERRRGWRLEEHEAVEAVGVSGCLCWCLRLLHGAEPAWREPVYKGQVGGEEAENKSVTCNKTDTQDTTPQDTTPQDTTPHLSQDTTPPLSCDRHV